MGGTTSRANMTPQQELQTCMRECRDISLNKVEARQKQINKKRIEQDAAELARREGAEFKQMRNMRRAEEKQRTNEVISAIGASGGASASKVSNGKKSNRKKNIKKRKSKKRSNKRSNKKKSNKKNKRK
tara:strand:- start:561 stop:947 length:387 start_codon:yes stop_codon:yes gene_type:complete